MRIVTVSNFDTLIVGMQFIVKVHALSKTVKTCLLLNVIARNPVSVI